MSSADLRTQLLANLLSSMEAHLQLASAHLPTISFGTGSLVRLPGPTITQPNVYHFNSTTYRAIHDELAQQNTALYTHNGLLNMLGRNLNIKGYPERFQDWVPGKPRLDHAEDKGSQGTESGVVDVVVTCEERCFDAVLEDLHNKGGKLNRPVHVFNVDIRDNHEEALVGGKAILELALSLNGAAWRQWMAIRWRSCSFWLRRARSRYTCSLAGAMAQHACALEFGLVLVPT